MSGLNLQLDRKMWVGIIGFVIAGVLLAAFPALKDTLGFRNSLLIFMYSGFFWIAQATSWNILTGYSGYFSFGQGAFYGIGVYTTAVLMSRYEWTFYQAMPIAGIMAAIVGLMVGFVVFRLRQLRADLFGLLTLAIGFVTASVVRNIDWIDGGFGVRLGRVAYPEVLGDFPAMIFRMGLFVALLSVFVSFLIYNSRLGRGLFALRDDEKVAAGLGVPTFRYKMAALGISTFLAGLSGGLHAVQIGYVTVESVFQLSVPLFVILMSLLGGRHHWMGPVIGAVLIHTLDDAFTTSQYTIGALTINGQLVKDLLIGTLLIVIILFVPNGIFERLRQRIIPSTVVAVGFGWLQATYFPGRITFQAAMIMLVVLVVVLIPERMYKPIAGRFDLNFGPRTKLKTASGEGEVA